MTFDESWVLSHSDESHGAREQSVVHHRGSAEVDPLDVQVVEPRFPGLLFDEMELFHHQEREESDASGSGGDADFDSFAGGVRGGAGGEQQQESEE
jgi:hypothetical protein